jgi:hypothetical protein
MKRQTPSPRSLTVEALEPRSLLAGMMAPPPPEHDLYVVQIRFVSDGQGEYRTYAEAYHFESVHRDWQTPSAASDEQRELPPLVPAAEPSSALPPAAGESAARLPTSGGTTITTSASAPPTVIASATNSVGAYAPHEPAASKQAYDRTAIPAFAPPDTRASLDAQSKDAVFATEALGHIDQSASFIRPMLNPLPGDWSRAVQDFVHREADYQADLTSHHEESFPASDSQAASLKQRPETPAGDDAAQQASSFAEPSYVSRTAHLDRQVPAQRPNANGARLPADGGLAEIAIAPADYRLLRTETAAAAVTGESQHSLDDCDTSGHWLTALPSRTQSLLLTAVCSIAAVLHVRRREKRPASESATERRPRR